MESTIGDYTEDEKYLCPICGHTIEDMEESLWDPCEHVVGCYIDCVGDWEILDDDLRDKFDEDQQAADECEDDEGNPLQEPEVDPYCIDEWGMANIDADLCVTLSDGPGISCSTSYYFFKE